MESSNSTGLLSGLDGPSNPIYADIASLETVCEDQEGMGGTKLRTTGKLRILKKSNWSEHCFSFKRRFRWSI